MAEKSSGRARRAAVSIRDVAAHAGVSLSTVSQVLNGNDKARIALKTQERVREAARELGYHPNSLARGLVRGRTEAVGVLVSALSNPYFLELAESIQVRCETLGYAAMLSTAPAWRGSYGGHGHVDAGGGAMPVDGLLTWTRDGHAARDFLGEWARLLPTVYLGGRSRDAGDHVAFDLRGGARLLAEYAFERVRERGGGRVTHLMPYDFASLDPGEERFATFEAAAREHGVELEHLAAPVAGETRESGFSAAQEIVARPLSERPSCVLCHNDAMALGLLDGLLRAGVRVPEDVTLAGFDGIAAGRFAARALTTVSCSPDEMARRAVERLLWRLDGHGDAEPEHVMLRPRRGV